MADTPWARNLGAAKMAVTYVQSKMDIGASNKIGIGMIAKAMCAGGTFNKGELRSKVDQDLAQISSPSWRDVLYLSADWAKLYGCGNCGEQSALAFVYLKQQGILPLDWMQIGNFKHAFVIIGRNGDSDPSDFNTWSKSSVVCDPWAGRAEPKLYIGVWNWKPNLLYREE